MNRRLEKAFAEIDAANAEDPRRDVLEGVEMPFEQVYSRRLLERLLAMYPDAPDVLRVAAFGQHVRRFDVSRDRFAPGRKGYNRWRKAAREHHAEVLGGIMRKSGFSEAEVAEAQKLVRKEGLKRDRLAQALENAVDVVFIEHYLQPFVEKYAEYDEDKLVDILLKTLLKMSPKGHAAALALNLPAEHRRLIEKAMEKGKGKLEKLALAELDW